MDKLSIPSIENRSKTIKTNFFTPKVLFYSFVYEMSLFLHNYHGQRQEFYQKSLKKIQKKKDNNHTVKKKPIVGSVKISKEILESVTLKLHAFETQKQYLNQEVSLNSLSKSLGTNSSYLSKIINHCKGKSFKNYLNDMRIAHAREDLSKNPNKRKYTIEAIAFDSGFKSAESFSKKFKETYGMYPSVFLRNLKDIS